MMKMGFYTLIWLAISLLAGVVGSYLFKVDFWFASLIAGIVFIVNGLIAEWEDRRRDRDI